eukprot:gnl/TRDRNA2_/TRDRNA2_153098_c0_seq3.p1 gnl/TRDRNA2_/TRDRNA2_153098_c0~~gnl/TRDRNA2_/TRDRNA2_153098_c0_seq3.p1  ORF type:complete len:328 (+),score=38.25 gnl/TRDRNA2_/TRDRNA2_153098_c0_seq3:74-1057(+)
MSEIKVVAVTGASGFIGSHIVKACLERGFTVNACVRNKDDPKNKFLTELPKSVGKGAIHLFSAELTNMGSYDAPVRNADAVIHAAAQVDPAVIKDPWKDMVEPSTKGTLNILSSVNKFNIRHYVHTSSMAAVGGHPKRPVNEDDWNTQSIEDSPYNFAKKEAEKLLWAETKGKSYTVSAINPSMVFGPCLAKPHAKASPYVFRQALYGNKQPQNVYSIVDVRDVARAHVEAMLRPEANGKRFILDGDGNNVYRVNEIIQKCREMFPTYKFTDAPGKGPAKIPSRTTDNTRSKTVLGIKYMSHEDCIRDSVSSMVDPGWVPVTPFSKL